MLKVEVPFTKHGMNPCLLTGFFHGPAGADKGGVFFLFSLSALFVSDLQEVLVGKFEIDIRRDTDVQFLLPIVFIIIVVLIEKLFLDVDLEAQDGVMQVSFEDNV